MESLLSHSTAGTTVPSSMYPTWDKSSLLNRITGKDRHEFLEKIVVGDVVNQKPNSSNLSLILNEKAGIIDDTIFSNHGDYL